MTEILNSFMSGINAGMWLAGLTLTIIVILPLIGILIAAVDGFIEAIKRRQKDSGGWQGDGPDGTERAD